MTHLSAPISGTQWSIIVHVFITCGYHFRPKTNAHTYRNRVVYNATSDVRGRHMHQCPELDSSCFILKPFDLRGLRSV